MICAKAVLCLIHMYKHKGGTHIKSSYEHPRHQFVYRHEVDTLRTNWGSIFARDMGQNVAHARSWAKALRAIISQRCACEYGPKRCARL